MGLYEFVFMPFGLKNAPATFQCVINHVLAPVLGKFCVAYLDDVIIYSDNKQEHAEHVKTVLTFLSTPASGLRLTNAILGSLRWSSWVSKLSDQGISPITERCVTIRDLNVEKSIKGIQSFMGLVRYYQCFCAPLWPNCPSPSPNFSGRRTRYPSGAPNRTRPIIKLSPHFLEPPLLAHFDPALPTLLHTDASNYAVELSFCKCTTGWSPLLYASNQVLRGA
jgi:hypothetical protein